MTTPLPPPLAACSRHSRKPDPATQQLEHAVWAEHRNPPSPMPNRLPLSPATLRTCGLSLLAALVALLGAGCERAAPQSTGTAPASAAGKLDPNAPDFQKRVQARLAEMEREEAIREEAPWFGKTGLAEEQERELPRYLRREFGQLLSNPAHFAPRIWNTWASLRKRVIRCTTGASTQVPPGKSLPTSWSPPQRGS